MTHLEKFLEKQGIDLVQTKYQSVTLTVVSGTAAGIYPTAEFNADSNYHVCDGISITEEDDGGLDSYKVSVRNNNGKIIESIPIGTVGVGKADGSAPGERFMEVLFDNTSGNKITLEATTSAATSGSSLIVTATLRLRKLSRALNIPSN